MIQFMPANHSNTNRVIAILIHSDKTRFQNDFVTLLRRVAKDVTSSLLSWHKRYDFNAANLRRHSQWKCALQTQWIRMGICDRKMIQSMPANRSNTNRVITILIHSDKTLCQNVFVTLLRRVAKDVTSSLLSWHKRDDFNAANFRCHSQWKCALQT